MITVELALKIEIDTDEAKDLWRLYNEALDHEDRVKWGDVKSILQDPEQLREFLSEGDPAEPMDFVGWALEQAS